MTSTENVWVQRAETAAREVLAGHAADVDQTGRWPAESLAALGQCGLMGLTVPSELTGGGAGPRTFATVCRVLAEHCASTAMIYKMHICGTQVIAAALELPLRQSVLRAIAAGKHLSTLAFSEKGSRSHFWAPVSQAVLDGDKHRLSAEKSWVTSAGHADSYIVPTRSAGRAEPLASTLYYVPKDTPGLTVSGPWNGLGMRGNASNPMRLQDVTLPASYRLSGEGDGFNTMLTVVLPWFQLGNAAISVGIARAATEGTRQHLLASRLEHLGQLLASLMNLRARLAQMQILVETHQLYVDQAAAQMENGEPTAMLTLMKSKAATSEAAVQVTDLAMRTCGGAAFSRHLGVERNFRDSRAGWVMAPTTDVLYDFIGKSLLGMPLF